MWSKIIVSIHQPNGTLEIRTIWEGRRMEGEVGGVVPLPSHPLFDQVSIIGGVIAKVDAGYSSRGVLIAVPLSIVDVSEHKAEEGAT